jgi:hypothetical protein
MGIVHGSCTDNYRGGPFIAAGHAPGELALAPVVHLNQLEGAITLILR